MENKQVKIEGLQSGYWIQQPSHERDHAARLKNRSFDVTFVISIVRSDQRARPVTKGISVISASFLAGLGINEISADMEWAVTGTELGSTRASSSNGVTNGFSARAPRAGAGAVGVGGMYTLRACVDRANP